MSKEVLNHVCSYCESVFRLSYDTDDITSLAKFCPFCSEESVAAQSEDDFPEIDVE